MKNYTEFSVEKELPPKATAGSDYEQFGTSDVVHIIGRTDSNPSLVTAGVYDYKRNRWLCWSSAPVEVLFWLRETE